MSHPEHPDRQDAPRQTKAEREAQAELILRWVGGRLIKVAEPGWARIDVRALLAADVQDLTFAVIDQTGTSQQAQLPQEVFRAFPDLRDLLYEDGEGTWFSLRIEIEPPDFISGTYNFDVDPLWDPPIPPEAFIRDLARYPRSGDNIPQWLQAVLSPEQAAESASRGAVGDIVERSKQAVLQVRMALSPGWTWVQLDFREIGGYFETHAVIRDVAGRLFEWSPPAAVGERFDELRAAMRGRPAVWYRARLDFFYSGEEKLQTFGPEEPEWDEAPGREAYVEELRRAGESREGMPDWMLRKLDEFGI